MKRLLLPILLVFSLIVCPSSDAKALTNAQIQKRLIQESIESYPGNCPCPYNTARNGSNCGGRSAYSRPGGYEPLCYPKDVTPAMIKDYRQNHKN